MNGDKTESLSADSIAAGHSRRDDWLQSVPLPIVQPIYNTSIYYLPSSAAGEAIISLKARAEYCQKRICISYNLIGTDLKISNKY